LQVLTLVYDSSIATRNQEHNMNTAELDKVIDEINEVVDGRRGWVSLTKARAKIIGISHELLLGCAKAYSLKVAQHGRMGWTASLSA
jgi:hypothetical protein